MTKKEWEKLHPQDKKEIISLIKFKERLKKWKKQKSIKQF